MPGIKQTYDRIVAYLNGILSDRQRHDLEKDMMQDIFEEDAFEGLSSLSGGELEADMEVLESRLKERTAPAKKRRMVIFLRIAALILFIIGLGGILYFVIRTPEVNLLSEEKVIEKSVGPDLHAAPDVVSLPADSPGRERNRVAAGPVHPELNTRMDQTRAAQKTAGPESDTRTDQTVDNLQTETADETISGAKTANRKALRASEDLVVLRPEKLKKNADQDLPQQKAEENVLTSPMAEKQLQGRVAGVAVSEETDNEYVVNDPSETADQVKPVPAGGSVKEFKKWVNGKLNYEALKAYPGKYRILVNLIVREDGTISDFSTRDSVPEALSEELKKVISQSPRWKPAIQDNFPVESKIAIRFVITIE